MEIEQLSSCTAETNVISSLADRPNRQSGLTAAQLKAKFDAADAAIKAYINETLVPYINETLAAAINDAADSVADGAVTTAKLASGAVTAPKLGDGAVTTAKLASDFVLPAAKGGTGNANGLAASATKLETARTVQTNLAGTEAAEFDGTENVTPGVTGTLSIGNGGTDATEAAAALANLGGANITELWVNERPYSAFASQNIAIDFSPYDLVLVLARYHAGSSGYDNNSTVSTITQVGVTGILTIAWGDSGYMADRQFYPTSNNILFLAAERDGSNTNDFLIPYKICGIRGVQAVTAS